MAEETDPSATPTAQERAAQYLDVALKTLGRLAAGEVLPGCYRPRPSTVLAACKIITSLAVGRPVVLDRDLERLERAGRRLAEEEQAAAEELELREAVGKYHRPLLARLDERRLSVSQFLKLPRIAQEEILEGIRPSVRGACTGSLSGARPAADAGAFAGSNGDLG